MTAPTTNWNKFYQKFKAAKTASEKHRLNEKLFQDRKQRGLALTKKQEVELTRLCWDGRKHRVFPKVQLQNIRARSPWHRTTRDLFRVLNRLDKTVGDQKLARFKETHASAWRNYLDAWSKHGKRCAVGKLIRIPKEPKGTTLGSDRMGFFRPMVSSEYPARLVTAFLRLGLPAIRLGKVGIKGRDKALASKAKEWVATMKGIKEFHRGKMLKSVDCPLQRRAGVALLVWDSGEPTKNSPIRAAAIAKLKERGTAVVRDVIAIMEAELGMGPEGGKVLSILTGKDFGDNWPAWKKWYHNHGMRH